MLPSDITLKIRPGTVGYKNYLEKPIKNHKTNSLELTHAPAISQKNQEPMTITHSDEKITLVLALAEVVLQYGICLDEISINVYYFWEDFI